MTNSYVDNFLRLLAGKQPHGVVWTADISYWISGRQTDGTADPAWKNEQGYLDLHRSLGVMPYYYYDRFWLGRAAYDRSVSLTTTTEGPVTRRGWESPAGRLVEESRYLPESACQGVTRHPVQSAADLDVLLDLLERRRLEPENLSDYGRRREEWAAYGGLPCLGLPRSPLSALAYEWMGVESLTYLLLDEPGRMRRALDLMEKQEQPVLDAVCAAAPPLVHFPDNLSSDNLSSLYDEYLAPVHRRRLEKLHAAGVKAAVHLDGTVRGLLPKLAAAGFDAIEALTPKPAGDLSVQEMDDLAGGAAVILWGGVPGVLFAPPYTWADMRRHVETVLESWQGRPFVLGVADQVPPDGDITFCRKIADLLP